MDVVDMLRLNQISATNLFEVGIKRNDNRGKVGASFIFHLLRSTDQNAAQYPLFGQLEDLNGLKILSKVAAFHGRSQLAVVLEFPLEK